MYAENRARSASVMIRMCSLADRALSEFNFLFHLKSKTNLVRQQNINLSDHPAYISDVSPNDVFAFSKIEDKIRYNDFHRLKR